MRLRTYAWIAGMAATTATGLAQRLAGNLPSGDSLFVQTVGAFDLSPANSLDQWTVNAIASGQYVRTCVSGGCDLVGTVHLPSGVRIHHVELDACDTDDGAAVTAVLYECDDTASGPGPCTAIDNVSTSGSAGCLFVNGQVLDVTVENLNHDYVLDVAVPADLSLVGLRGLKIYYALQVSSAPGVATFDDVPATDPAFQFIEAFTAAGITAGCSTSPPLYCPNATVTRRQMAVFFAKAFGLHFPG